MSIKSIMKNLFGSETEKENQQLAPNKNEEKEQPKSNLGKEIQFEEESQPVMQKTTSSCEESSTCAIAYSNFSLGILFFIDGNII